MEQGLQWGSINWWAINPPPNPGVTKDHIAALLQDRSLVGEWDTYARTPTGWGWGRAAVAEELLGADGHLLPGLGQLERQHQPPGPAPRLVGPLMGGGALARTHPHIQGFGTGVPKKHNAHSHKHTHRWGRR